MERLWRCIGDALEIHQKSAEFNTQGHTLTESHHFSPLSLVPDALHSSYEMPDSLLMNNSLAVIHLEVQELQDSLVSLKYESLIKSESELLDAQSIPQILLAPSANLKRSIEVIEIILL